MEESLTTILIPARIRSTKDLSFLKQAIQSAKGQGKILVGFNQCTVSVQSIKKLLVDWIEIPNVSNLAQVRNILVKQVKTKYFFFLDHDDLLPPDAISVAEFSHPGPGFYVYGKTLLFSSDSSVEFEAKCFDTEKLLQEVFFPNGVLQLTSNLEITGLWDESLSILEDKEFWIRAATLGICGYPIQSLLYKYRSNPKGLVATTKNTPLWHQSSAYIKEKFKSYYEGKPMGCKKCPKPSSVQTSSPLPTISQQEVVLHYNLKTGRSVYYGFSSKKPYYVSAENPLVAVLKEDLFNEVSPTSNPGLLQLYKRGIKVFKE